MPRFLPTLGKHLVARTDCIVAAHLIKKCPKTTPHAEILSN